MKYGVWSMEYSEVDAINKSQREKRGGRRPNAIQKLLATKPREVLCRGAVVATGDQSCAFCTRTFYGSTTGDVVLQQDASCVHIHAVPNNYCVVVPGMGL